MTDSSSTWTRRSVLTSTALSVGLGAGLSVGLSAGLGGRAVAAPRSWDDAVRRGRGQRWPGDLLPAAAGEQVDLGEFLPTWQLAAWGDEVNELGLRATGSATHESYVQVLERRLREIGLHGVRREPVPMRQWLATRWSLEAAGERFKHVFYVPYSQRTGPAGVSGELVYVPIGDVLNADPTILSDPDALLGTLASSLDGLDIAGKIAVFEVAYTSIPLAAFAALSYPGGFRANDRGPTGLAGVYSRPWFNTVGQILDLLTQAGAAGTIGIWSDLPGRWARQYSPYDGEFRPIPGLWVDKTEGQRLKELATGGGAQARMVLRATVRDTVTHNLVGFIPGRSPELTVLHTHTDGTNGMEENGQLGVLAAAQYLARLPRKALDRTVMVMLSTGHFAGGVGIKHFLDRHADDLVPRITSILTLEHLGCREFQPTSNGTIEKTGRPELGAWFSPNAPGLVDAVVAEQNRIGIDGAVVRPFLPGPSDAKYPIGYPGEGTYWWWYGGIPTANYITGPYGLIAADLDTTGMVDYRLMRRIAAQTVPSIVQLAATSTSDLTVSPV